MAPLADSDFSPSQAGEPLPAWAGWTRASRALYALAGLVLIGIVLRLIASAAVWPTVPSLADSWPYAYYAGTETLADPQHPAGYSVFLAIAGIFTHSVGAFVVLQHLIGIASALILFAAVRRLCGSPWPGVVGAAVILLGADQLFLEDTIMSEVLFTLLMVGSVYAVARALEDPLRWWPWPALAGVLVSLAAITRTAGLFLIPVFVLVLVLARPRPWLPRWKPVAVCLGAACAVLLAYATANSIDHSRFGVTPSPGWRLYARVAPFADCSKFTPPQGTESLCESKPAADRYGSGWYLFDPKSPASRLYGQLGETRGAGDGKLAAFARQAILHQPGDYADTVVSEGWAYLFPDSYGAWKPGRGTGLDGQVSWHYGDVATPAVLRSTQQGMEEFFSPFTVHADTVLVDALYDYQRVFRLGAALLLISTLLILGGLFVGPRRSRIAVAVLGVSGLATIFLPLLSSEYIGRYTVPPAGMIAAGATVSLLALAGRSSPVRARIERLFAARSPSPPSSQKT